MADDKNTAPKTIAVSVFQHYTTGSLTVTCNKPTADITRSNRLVQVWQVTDYSGKTMTDCRKHIKAKTENGTKEFEGNRYGAAHIERIIDGLNKYDEPKGTLTVTPLHKRELMYLVMSKADTLKALQKQSQIKHRVSQEVYVYINFSAKKISVLPRRSQKVQGLMLFKTYMMDSTSIKDTVINSIKLQFGSNKGIPANQTNLKALEALFDQHCRVPTRDKLTVGLNFNL